MILLIALYYEPEEAGLMIMHIWYLALLPSAMFLNLQNSILPLTQGVVELIEDEPSDSVISNVFAVDNRQVRLVLKRREWISPLSYFHVRGGISAEQAQGLRHQIMLNPPRIDYRDRNPHLWTPAARQGETHFRNTGVFYIVRGQKWNRTEHATVISCWSHDDYDKHRLVAKAEIYGAIFSPVRDLLLKFCARVREVNILFELFCWDAKEISGLLEGRQFGRIEISNACDRQFLGPRVSIEVFAPLLKVRTRNPKATLLMYFLTATIVPISHASPEVEESADEAANLRAPPYNYLFDGIDILTEWGGRLARERQKRAVNSLGEWGYRFKNYATHYKMAETSQLCGAKMKSEDGEEEHNSRVRYVEFKSLVRQVSQSLAPLATAQDGIDPCCDALAHSAVNTHLLYPGETAFKSRLDSYFDVKQQSITPRCIVQPRAAEGVSIAIKALTATSLAESCKFAIRSGGQTPYAGASNIQDGVIIDLQYISAVEYDAEDSLVKVGPGARWSDVFTALEPLGVMTTGGRSSTVGVGGSTLGGGISYFSAEHGLICDNVLEFEVVLADGRIVTASKTKNLDLFTVLKGGNNNFGIVTQFKFRTFKYDGMWGGLVIYPETTIQDQFKALVNFSDNMDKNPKSAAIVIPLYQSRTGMELILNSYDHTEPVVRPAAFHEFLAIPGNISDTTAVTNMSDLAAAFASQNGTSVYFGTFTFTNDLRVMTMAHEFYKDTLADLKVKATGDWQIYTLYQPLPPAYWKESAARGGNVLGLERFDGQTLCLYQIYMSWQGAEQDAIFQEAGANLVDRIADYAIGLGAGIPYLYLDYADKSQSPLINYGPENFEKMMAAVEKYDSKQTFQKNVPGGFKILRDAQLYRNLGQRRATEREEL
ncbi:hypothetical protein E8E11_011584 [Didymella keratinophila]|nr:hypothetical protein E8E11_011584 [Didymella keratinophila]